MEKDKSLDSKSRKAFGWDLVGTFIRQFVTLGISIILARLLTPEEFGVIGIALVFVSLTQVFIDVGFTDGLVYRQSVDDLLYSSIFYLNCAISFLMAILIVLVAPIVGNFYDNSDITSVLYYLALIPPIAALGKVHSAILVKNLNFKALSIRDVVAVLMGGTLGVIAAIKGMGVYSLVWQQITTTIVGTILLWVGSKWQPKSSFSWTEVRALFSYSSFIFFDQLLRQFFQRVDTIFIGKVFSTATLGFYSRAESLNAQIMSYTATSLRKVIFPTLSSLQDDSEKFEEVYLKIFKLVTVITVALSGLLYFLADVIILNLLGEKWLPTVIIFQILIFKTSTGPLGALIGKSLLSRGHSKKKFRVGLLQRALTLIPLLFGLFYGIETFAIVVVLINFINISLGIYFVQRYLNISFLKQLKSLLKPLLLGFIIIYLMKSLLSFNSFLSALIFIITYAIILILTKDEGFLMLKVELEKIFFQVKHKFIS